MKEETSLPRRMGAVDAMFWRLEQERSLRSPTLAVAVLWWFLRKFRATLIVALSIPLCLFVSFLVMNIAGRTLNIISLAGLAFATGMLLGAARVTW